MPDGRVGEVEPGLPEASHLDPLRSMATPMADSRKLAHASNGWHLDGAALSAVSVATNIDSVRLIDSITRLVIAGSSLTAQLHRQLPDHRR